MSTEVDNTTIRDIKISFVKDGLSWSLEPEQKIIHLWKKNSRTEGELQKVSNENHQLRKQMKNDMGSVQDQLEKVRQLSSEKEHVLKEENAKLRQKMDDLTLRYEVLLEERIVLEKLYSSGEDCAATQRNSPFQYFLEERTELVREANEGRDKMRKQSVELSELRLQFDESESTIHSLQEQLAQSLANLEVERSRMDTIKGDHEKQRKLHRKQIRDHREKLSEIEAKKSKDDESSNVSHQLKETLSEISLLSSELNKSTGIAEETDRLNLLLNEEVSKANLENEQLIERIDQLTKEMTEEREKSIEVLERQLEKQHELQSYLEVTQLEVNAHKRTVQVLTDELAREQEANEELQTKVQDLEQRLHQRTLVTLEKELMQRTVYEHERTIETIDNERSSLQRCNQDLSARCQMLERKLREQLSIMDELSKELSGVVEEKEECNKENTQLVERISFLEEENRQLEQSVADTRSKMESLSVESLTYSQQHKEQEESLENRLSQLQSEKQEIVKEMEEEAAQHESMKELLAMTITQLQDELHSKTEELTRSRLETQKAIQDIASLKQNLDKEVVVKHEADLKFETLKMKNQSLIENLQDLQHEKNTLSQQMALEKEHTEAQILATQRLAMSEKEAAEEEKKLEMAILKTELESVIKEKEMSLTNLSGKLDATIEMYEKRLKMVQESLDSSQEKLMENQLSLESKCTTLNETLKRFQEEKAERLSLENKLKVMQDQFNRTTIQYSASKEKLRECKANLEKQLQAMKHMLETTQEKYSSEKEKFQGQIMSLQEQKLAMDRELSAYKTLLDKEKAITDNLEAAKNEKEGEVDLMEGLLDKSKKDLQESSKKIEEREESIADLESRLESTKLSCEATEKELKLVQEDCEGLKVTIEETKNVVKIKEDENELLKSNIEEKLASLDELKAIIEEKEKKLEDTIMQLMEVDSLWLKTQNELETEKAERLKLIHDSRLSQHSRSKDIKQVSGLLQERTNLKALIKELRLENSKMLSASRRSESKLAKKTKEMNEVEADKKKLEDKVSHLEDESSSYKDQLLQQHTCNKVLSSSLEDELREEKLKVVLKDQAISSLNKKVKRMAATIGEMETMLKQKEDDIYQTEVSVREQKIKAQAMAEKVEDMINEKEVLKSTIHLLREECVFQKSSITKLQNKLEHSKATYSMKSRLSKEKLASTWSDFTQKREDLENTLDDMTNKLRVVQKKLDIEYQWRNTSEGFHHKILQEKSHLMTKLGEVEKELGEKDQELAELAVKLERMQHENIMLEERNKILVEHIQSSRSSIQEQDSQKLLQRLSSSGGGIQSLMNNPISPSHHFHYSLNPASTLTNSAFTLSRSAPLHNSTPLKQQSSISSSSSSVFAPLYSAPDLHSSNGTEGRLGNDDESS